ncbi:MAG: gamma carbonic anhydrase family protein [Chloroflexi bacterium]|nr:gamma carbonic anhydrase family protein [Chloroflexota bacterium]
MIIEFKGKRPFIAPDAYIAPNATIIGDVTIGAEASVWFGAVIRGDEGKIMIGARTSVQDNVVIHVNSRSDTIIEENVTIGHGAVMEGCHIGAGSLIGMNATVLSEAKVGAGCLIAAGAVVGESAEIPARVLAVGMPAKVKRPLSREMQARLAYSPKSYVAYRQDYLEFAEVIE